MAKKRGAKLKAAVKAAVESAGGVAALASKVDKMAMKVDRMAGEAKDGPARRVGTKVGQALGMPGFGALVGRGIGRVLGTGDYTVVNSLIKPGSEAPYARSPVPSFGSSRRAGQVVRVRHREYVGTLKSGQGTPTGFTVQNYRLNPGNPYLFPWLSAGVALSYEKWRPLGMLVELVSLASEAVTSSPSLGVMGIAMDYNGLDPNYSSKAQAEQSDGCVSAKVSEDVMFGIECDPSQRPYQQLYVRTGAPSGGVAAINTFDLGNLQVFSQGVTGTNADLAEIWVTYDIEFDTVELEGGLTGNQCYVAGFQGTAVTSAAPMGVSYLRYGNTWFPTLNTTVFGFPDYISGTFFVAIEWQGGAATYAAPAATLAGNVSYVAAWPSGYLVTNPYGTTSGASGTGCYWRGVVQVTPASVYNQAPAANHISFDGTGTFGSSCVVNVMVMQLPAQPSGNPTFFPNTGLTLLTANPWQ